MGKMVMGIEEGTFWDEHWVLYGNQFDNKFHVLKKKKKRKGFGSQRPTVYCGKWQANMLCSLHPMKKSLQSQITVKLSSRLLPLPVSSHFFLSL